MVTSVENDITVHIHLLRPPGWCSGRAKAQHGIAVVNDVGTIYLSFAALYAGGVIVYLYIRHAYTAPAVRVKLVFGGMRSAWL